MKRFAIVLIVEAEDEEVAMRTVQEAADVSYPERFVYIGDPCSVGPAAEYETEAIHLTADGELVFAAPAPGAA